MEPGTPSRFSGASEASVSLGNWRLRLERIAPAPTELQDLYDRAAWRWDWVIRMLGFSSAYERLFARLACDGWLKALGDGARLLDVGIGTGALSVAMTNTTQDTYNLHGIDLSPRMLARARRNLASAQKRGATITLRYGDAAQLPYDAATFDWVMCAHLLEHCATPQRVLDDMIRVLRPGATALFVVTRNGRRNGLHRLRWRYRAIDPVEMRDWMAAAGLQDVRRYALGAEHSLTGRSSEVYVGHKPMTLGDEWAT